MNEGDCEDPSNTLMKAGTRFFKESDAKGFEHDMDLSVSCLDGNTAASGVEDSVITCYDGSWTESSLVCIRKSL